MQFGIDNLKKAVKLGIDVATNIVTDTADKKISLGEILAFAPVVVEAIGVTKDWAAIKDEVADLDDTERKELNDYVAQEFNIPNEKVEVFVEHSLSLVLSIIALAEEIKGLKTPPATV